MVRAIGRRLGQDHAHEGPGRGGDQLNPQNIVLEGVSIDADSVDIGDNEKLYLGDNDRWSLMYDADVATLVLTDEANDESKLRFDDNGDVELVDKTIARSGVELDADQKLYVGGTDRWSFTYDSNAGRMVLRDEVNNEDKLRFDDDTGDVVVVSQAVVEGQLVIDDTTGSIQLPSSFN